jgi:hypothetical protein
MVLGPSAAYKRSGRARYTTWKDDIGPSPQLTDSESRR